MKISNPSFSTGSSWCLLANLVAATLVLGSFDTQAQSDDFNDGNDTGWTRYDPLAGFGAPATFSFPAGGYGIQSGTSPNPLALGPGRAGSVRNDQVYSGFSVTFDVVNWNNTLNQAFGALARVNQLGLGTTDGYSFTYATGGSIDISRILNEGPTGLGSAPITLNPANDYRFVFTGTGTNLSGQVFDLANLSTPLATLNASDATYASGVSGFVVFDNTAAGTGSANATFDNYIGAVPEPSTAALFIIGGVALCGIRRRWRAAAP